MASSCDACGLRDNEVKGGSGIEPLGRKIRLKLTDVSDLSRDVLKVLVYIILHSFKNLETRFLHAFLHLVPWLFGIFVSIFNLALNFGLHMGQCSYFGIHIHWVKHFPAASLHGPWCFINNIFYATFEESCLSTVCCCCYVFAIVVGFALIRSPVLVNKRR